MELRKKKTPGPESNALFWCREGKDPPGFKIKNFTKKGRGIVTCKKFDKGDFLLEYVGERISLSEGDRRENIFSSGFRYFLKTFCIDATEETNRLCRLVNHGEKKERNAKMKLIEENKLCLFATRDLKVGEEVLYDYGIGSNSLPWKTQYATNDPGQTNEEEPLTNIDGDDNQMFNDEVETSGSEYVPKSSEEEDDDNDDDNIECSRIEDSLVTKKSTWDLKVGEEVLYDYGVSSNSLPWKTQYATNDPGQTNEEEPLTNIDGDDNQMFNDEVETSGSEYVPESSEEEDDDNDDDNIECSIEDSLVTKKSTCANHSEEKRADHEEFISKRKAYFKNIHVETYEKKKVKGTTKDCHIAAFAKTHTTQRYQNIF
uniref:Uncharacterized protein LOC111134076 isoform X3 n=1 Tax=Crassostrea virginica TaxID=6565 RepID=A0A8B8EG32_CRAVI|nr:uncharacterized protein LOC111134076 isoform X3 [Crassostrea virginica]